MTDPSAMHAVAALGCAIVLSAIATALLVRWSPCLGLVDHPNERKLHHHVVPKGGGLAIFAAFVLTLAVSCPPMLRETRWSLLLGWSLGIVVLGLLDDLYSLPWQLRLVAQTVAGVAVFGWPMQTGWLPAPLAVIWVVGLLNAFNMLDNMDALSAGVALIVALLLATTLWGQTGPSALPYVILAGALLGFFWFNRPPARIYMGDAGSTFLGFFFGVQSLQEDLARPDAPASWAVPVCLFAVPWYDLATVVALRLSQRRSPFHADKQHLSHRLVAAGLSAPRAVGLIQLLALASGLCGVILYRRYVEPAWLIAAVAGVGWLSFACVDYSLWRRRNSTQRNAPRKV